MSEQNLTDVLRKLERELEPELMEELMDSIEETLSMKERLESENQRLTEKIVMLNGSDLELKESRKLKEKAEAMISDAESREKDLKQREWRMASRQYQCQCMEDELINDRKKFEEEKKNEEATVWRKAKDRSDIMQAAFEREFGFIVAMLAVYGFVFSAILGYKYKAFSGDIRLFKLFSGRLAGLIGNTTVGMVLAVLVIAVAGFILFMALGQLNPDRLSLIVGVYSFGLCLLHPYTVIVWLVINIAFNAIFERDVAYGEKFYKSLLGRL